MEEIVWSVAAMVTAEGHLYARNLDAGFSEELLVGETTGAGLDQHFPCLLASAHLLPGFRPLLGKQIVSLVRYLYCKLRESSCPESDTIMESKFIPMSLWFGKEREHRKWWTAKIQCCHFVWQNNYCVSHIRVHMMELLWSRINFKGGNKDETFYVGRSTTSVHNLLFCLCSLCMVYVTKTFSIC